MAYDATAENQVTSIPSIIGMSCRPDAVGVSPFHDLEVNRQVGDGAEQ